MNNRAHGDYQRVRPKIIGRTVAVDAIAFGRASLGAKLRQAREVSGLTQSELARRLNKSQTMVSHAELGGISIGERYVKAVLRACGLPANWKPT
jgi:predicted transcriptional regulator